MVKIVLPYESVGLDRLIPNFKDFKELKEFFGEKHTDYMNAVVLFLGKGSSEDGYYDIGLDFGLKYRKSTIADLLNILSSLQITRQTLLDYLQSQMDDYKENEKRYGKDDRVVRDKCSAMIACKEMVEVIIKEPVNLGLNGVISVGF